MLTMGRIGRFASVRRNVEQQVAPCSTGSKMCPRVHESEHGCTVERNKAFDENNKGLLRRIKI